MNDDEQRKLAKAIAEEMSSALEQHTDKIARAVVVEMMHAIDEGIGKSVRRKLTWTLVFVVVIISIYISNWDLEILSRWR